jgi:hypothetical protein
MIAAAFNAALGMLADTMRAIFIPDRADDAVPVAVPIDLAHGSSPAIAVADLATDAPCPPGLVACSTCNTMQRAGGGVHFASNTAIRPCVGSWVRR